MATMPMGLLDAISGVTAEEVQRVRESGRGKNFGVIDAADGFRRDNRLWFGTCDTCGERVTNSRLKGVWEHTVILETHYYQSGKVAGHKSKHVDYCPEAGG